MERIFFSNSLRNKLTPELGLRDAVLAMISISALLALGWSAWLFVQRHNAPPTVKIGLVAPFEGEYRNTGYEMLFAVKLALQERNRGEGLNGYRVELVALNDFNSPDEASRQARALVADPDVMGVVGHPNSEATVAALPVYQAAQLAVSIPWSVDTAAFETPGVVSVAATDQETLAGLNALMQTRGFEQIASLASPDGVGQIPAGAQAVQLVAGAVTAGETLLALQQAGNSLPRFGHADVGNRQLVQVAGPAATGLVIVSPGPDGADAANAADFVEAYRAVAGFPPSPRAVLAYDATQVLLDAIEESAESENKWYNVEVSRSSVSNRMVNVQREGLSGKIAFNKIGQRFDSPIWFYQITETGYPGILVDP